MVSTLQQRAVLMAKRILQQAQQRGAARDRNQADSMRFSIGEILWSR